MAIKTAQEASWKQLVETVEADPWGLPYKIVVKKIGGAPGGVEALGREDAIVRGLFSTTSPLDWEDIPLEAGPEEELMPFTRDELMKAAPDSPVGNPNCGSLLGGNSAGGLAGEGERGNP